MPTLPRFTQTIQATHAAHIQGWCPGALRPMPSGDGLVLRIRAPLGRLTQAQGLGIAELAARYAQPLLDLTSRANLQLRGIAQADYPALLAGLQALGLIDTDINAESRRNLLVSPFWEAGDGTPDLAGLLTEALAQPTAPQLPAKFGFALDCGPTPVLRGCSADIRLERHAQGFLVYANGSTHGVVAGTAHAVARAMDLAHWFIAAGGAPLGRGRMATLVAQTSVPSHLADTPVPATHAACPPWGLVPQGCVVGFEFGQMPVDTLHALSSLSPLRLTPWRSVLVEGAQSVPAIPAPSKLITNADDVRLRVSACTGAPGCNQAAAPTRELAHALAPLVPTGHTLHISGCSKGCAHPEAALTLVATSTGFNLIQHGTAASPPDARHLNPAAIAAHLKQLAHAPHL
jgi:precorrin-3B synthase